MQHRHPQSHPLHPIKDRLRKLPNISLLITAIQNRTRSVNKIPTSCRETSFVPHTAMDKVSVGRWISSGHRSGAGSGLGIQLDMSLASAISDDPIALKSDLPARKLRLSEETSVQTRRLEIQYGSSVEGIICKEA